MAKSYPTHAKDVPVTQKMLYLVRDELIARNNGQEKKFDSVDKRLEALELKVDSADRRLGALELKVDSMDKRLGALELKVDSMDKRLGALELKVDSMDKRLGALELKVDSMDKKFEARFDRLSADLFRIQVLVEEQNAKNNIVLEGLSSLFQRQERVENRMNETEALVRSLVKAKSRT